jgi:homoserine kinase
MTAEPGVRLDDSGHPDLPRDPNRHASAIAAAEVLRRAGSHVGVALSLEKGLPLSGGQGGSAASAVAGALATNTLLGDPLDERELLLAALVAEERLAGRHIDNLAPALFGGILLIRSIDPLDVVRLPVPPNLRVVLAHPQMLLRTTDARAVLPAMVDRATAIAQAAAVGAIVAALYSGDLSRLRGAIDDRIAEPARTPLLPGFAAAKAAALAAGALGASISGGGPSAFALVDGDADAITVMEAMIRAYSAQGVTATGRVARIDEVGARIEEDGA